MNFLLYSFFKDKKRTLISLDEFAKVYLAYQKNPETEFYHTIFQFDEELINHIHLTGQSRGFKGKCYEQFFPFDIDRENDLELARQDTLRLIEFFKGHGIESEDCQIYFSGGKGFHLIFSPELYGSFDPDSQLPDRMKGIAKKVEAESFVEIDQSLYQHLRIFRMPNSKHKSGKFKVQLTYPQLKSLSIEDILGYASQPQKLINKKYKLREKLKTYFGSVPMLVNFDNNEQGRLNIKSHTKLCILKILNSPPEPGIRNECLIRLVSHFSKEGFPPFAIKNMLSIWGSQVGLEESEIEATLRSGIYSRYSYPCDDVILDKFCDKNCCLYPAKSNKFDELGEVESDGTITNLYTMDEALDNYVEHVKIASYVKTGITSVDKNMRGFVQDDMIAILGRPGTLKSAVAFHIARYNAYMKVPVLVVSIEMNLLRSFERAMQQELKVGWKTIEKMSLERNDLILRANDKLKHLVLAPVPFIRPKEFLTLLNQYVVRFGSKPKIIIWDYLQLISADFGKSRTEAIESIFNTIKGFTRENHIISFVVSQVGRSSDKDTTKPLSLGSGKGTGAIEEASDYVFGLHDSSEDETLLICQILKNKTGATILNGLPLVKNYKAIDVEDLQQSHKENNE